MFIRLFTRQLIFLGILSYTTGIHAETVIGEPDFSIGGRVKLDAIYNDHTPGNGRLSRSDLSYAPSSVSLSGNNTGAIQLNPRESRLWATGHLPLYNRDLSAYVEIDFNPTELNDSGRSVLSNKPRLRHAYATYGGLTIGRTYTTFLNVSAYPEANDGNGPVSILNVRQDLLRYKKSFDWASFTLSLEESKSTLLTSAGSSTRTDGSDWIPDIITRLDFNNERGDWSVSAMARDIRSDGLVPGNTDSQWGAAASIAGRIYTIGQDNIRFSLAGGNVLGRYLSYNAFKDAVLTTSGQINLTEIIGTYVSYQHWWTRTVRSSLTVGYAQAFHDLSVVTVNVDKRYYSTHLNLIWSPTLNSSIGAEWLHGYREQESGSSGNLDRVQLTFIYKF